MGGLKQWYPLIHLYVFLVFVLMFHASWSVHLFSTKKKRKKWLKYSVINTSCWPSGTAQRPYWANIGPRSWQHKLSAARPVQNRQTPKTFPVRSHDTVLKNRFFYAENGHDKKEQDFDRAATRCFQRKRKACSDYRKHEGIFDANYDDDDAKLCLYVKTLVKPPAGDTPNWNNLSIVIIFYHVFFLMYMPCLLYLGPTYGLPPRCPPPPLVTLQREIEASFIYSSLLWCSFVA